MVPSIIDVWGYDRAPAGSLVWHSLCGKIIAVIASMVAILTTSGQNQFYQYFTYQTRLVCTELVDDNTNFVCITRIKITLTWFA